MGLIYVNPEGPNGNADPLASARDIRETFARMAMNDEETVALIAGGHTFGKTHGAGDADLRRPGARGRPARGAGPGLDEQLRLRQGRRHDHQSGLEVTWTDQPTQWSNRLLRDPLRLRVGAHQEPRRRQAVGRQGRRGRSSPDADDADSPKHKPTMLTTDLSLRFDPAYEKISRRFLENPDEFALAFAKAWYKLLHRDMGPVSRFLGPWVPEPQLWQDPVPAVDHELVGDADVAALKAKVLDSGLTIAQLVSTAWASAASFRSTDKRGGANGARIRLEPQRSWDGQPARAARRRSSRPSRASSASSTRPAARRSRSPT